LWTLREAFVYKSTTYDGEVGRKDHKSTCELYNEKRPGGVLFNIERHVHKIKSIADTGTAPEDLFGGIRNR